MGNFLDALPIVGDFASGIGDFFGSIFGNGRPSLSAQLDVNKQLAKYQHDLNMDAWREQTAYNDPSRQMERLKAAGINPNSIAGNSSMSGNAGPAPNIQSISSPDLTNFQRKINFSGLAQAGRAYAEARSIKQQFDQGKLYLKNQEADLLLKEKEALSKEMDNLLKNQEYLQKGTMFSYNLEAKRIANANALQQYLAIQKSMREIDARVRKLNLESDILGHQEKKWAEGINPFATWQDQLAKELINLIKNLFKDNDIDLSETTEKAFIDNPEETLHTLAEHYKGNKKISIPLYHLLRSFSNMDPTKGYFIGGM